MTTIDQTAFNKLEAEGRLLNAMLKAPTQKDGRFGFRGEFALKFAPSLADEKRPPEISAEQVHAVGEAGDDGFSFISAYLHSFEYLQMMVDVLGGALKPDGKYFMFCNNIDLSSKYQVPHGDTVFYVLPIDEATVYNETLELLNIERNDLKKLNTGGKLDAIYDAARNYSDSFEKISYEDGLKVMKPVRNKNENRPV